MTFILVHARERFDPMAGKVLKFLFHDTEFHHYRAEVPEGSPDFQRWYSLMLNYVHAEKDGKTIRIHDAKPKENTCTIPDDSPFKTEILERNWTPKPDGKKDIHRKDWE